MNIARVFDKQENMEELARILKAESKDSDAIILPAITGLNRDQMVEYLQKETNKPVYLLPTLPPSVPGIRTQQRLRSSKMAGYTCWATPFHMPKEREIVLAGFTLSITGISLLSGKM